MPCSFAMRRIQRSGLMDMTRALRTVGVTRTELLGLGPLSRAGGENDPRGIRLVGITTGIRPRPGGRIPLRAPGRRAAAVALQAGAVAPGHELAALVAGVAFVALQAGLTGGERLGDDGGAGAGGREAVADAVAVPVAVSVSV